MSEAPVCQFFNFHLKQSFSSITREAENIEPEWTIFHASITETDARRCGCKVVCAHVGGNSRGTRGKALKGLQRQLAITCRTSRVADAKTQVWEEFSETMEQYFQTASKWFGQTVR